MSKQFRLQVSEYQILREMIGMNNALDVSVDKYRVIQTKDGSLRILRNESEWRQATGDKLILTLAQEIAALRECVTRKEQEIELLKQSISEDDEVVAGGKYERISFKKYLVYLLDTDIGTNSLLKLLVQDIINHLDLNEEVIYIPVNDLRDKATGLQYTLQRVYEALKTQAGTHTKIVRDILGLIEVALNHYGTMTKKEKEEKLTSIESLDDIIGGGN